MNKLTAGILIGAGAAGLAAAAYVPYKTGDTVQQQIEHAVAAANAQQGQSGVEIRILNYTKNMFSSDLTTRILLNDPALSQEFGETPFVDIRHAIEHGFAKADFTSHVVVTEEMKTSLRDFDNKVPLHFDGSISTDQAVVNTYIEGFTLTPDSGSEMRMKPGIIRLNYDAKATRYELEGNWNGLKFSRGDDFFSVGEVSLQGEGDQYSEYIWNYDNSIHFSRAELNSRQVQISASDFRINDRLDVEADNTLNYNGHWTLDAMQTARYGQTLYNFEPSELRYSLSGPTVEQTEALMQAAQELNAERMTPEQAQAILPVFADVANAAEFSLSDVHIATTEGRIQGDMSLRLETTQQELIQALSFPPILTQYLKLEAEASVSKSLFASMPVFAMMAMQLNDRKAYQENEDDMLIQAEMSSGQLEVNGVPMR